MTIRLTQPPKTSDGRPIVLESRFRGDVDPYICGYGDHRTNGKGQGNEMGLGWGTQATADDKTVTWVFNDWVYVSSGGMAWANGQRGDKIDMWVDALATTAVANGGGTGNANEYALGGGAVLYTPAAGDGDTDITLDDYSASPVPSFDAEGNGTGYWDWSDADEGAGVLTPNAAGKGQYNLYNFDIKLVHWVCGVSLMGTGRGELDPYTKARKLLPHWQYSVKVHNIGHDDLEVTWWLKTTRKNTT